MAKISKRFKQLNSLVVPGKAYAIDEALGILKNNGKVKFVESIDVAVRLGVDARKSDQQVRGSTVLPEGTGKSVRVAVFCPAGEKADAAKEAGADVVGKLGTVLGPRGLMPNPKVGTVSPDPAQAVRNAKAGQVRYRTDKAGIIHCTIGKASFEVDALKNNLTALLQDLVKAKPASAKGQYLQKISVSSTMGLGITVDQATLSL